MLLSAYRLNTVTAKFIAKVLQDLGLVIDQRMLRRHKLGLFEAR